MALSNISKHCVITSALLSALCLIWTIEKISDLESSMSHTKSAASYIEDYYDNDFLKEETDHGINRSSLELAITIFLAASAISCILMMVGVFKRSVRLMAPWWLCVVAGICIANVFVYTCLSGSHNFDLFAVVMIVIIVLGGSFVLFNPFVAVFREVRQERAVKRSRV